MKNKILIITTFLLSFVILIGSVNADEDISLSCLYDGNKDCAHWYTVGLDFCTQGITLITQSTTGDINVYYTTKTITNYSDLYNYPIQNPAFSMYDKVAGKNKLEPHGKVDAKEMLKEKGCPAYVDYNTANINYTYDEPEGGKSFNSYYKLLSKEIVKKDTSTTETKELKCYYPGLNYQKELEINQSSTGKIDVTYGGEEDSVNFKNYDGESATGYDVSTGKFNYCPPCANHVRDNIYFKNLEADGSCESSYSGFKNTSNENWKFTCLYATNDKYPVYQKLELSYNEENFQINGISENQNITSSPKVKFTAQELWKNNSNSCPNHLKVSNVSQSEIIEVSFDGAGAYYSLLKQTNHNKTPEQPTKPEPNNCEELLGDEVIEIIDDVMKIIRIAVPILLIVFGMTDFLRATFSDSEENIKKDRDRFIKRIIAAIIVFIVPIFVDLVLHLANKVWSDINPETCIK